MIVPDGKFVPIRLIDVTPGWPADGDVTAVNLTETSLARADAAPISAEAAKSSAPGRKRNDWCMVTLMESTLIRVLMDVLEGHSYSKR
jgi:hypothetical protein